MRILLVEHYQPLVRAIRKGLEDEEWVVDVARTSDEASKKILRTSFDGIIFDLALPEDHGLSQLQRWRKGGLKSSVLVIAGNDNLDTRVRSLDMGADDCMSKPFVFDELLARLKALLRRGQQTETAVMRVRDLEIDTAARTVRRGNQSMFLTPREFSLLQFLANHRGKVVSRSMIWEHLYNDRRLNGSNVIDVYIRYLRNKIDKGFDTPLILTRWGQGYLLRSEEVQ